MAQTARREHQPSALEKSIAILHPPPYSNSTATKNPDDSTPPEFQIFRLSDFCIPCPNDIHDCNEYSAASEATPPLSHLNPQFVTAIAPADA